MDPIPSEPQGTWYLNADYRGGTNKNNSLLTITIFGDPFLGQLITINGQETLQTLDISWDANTGILEFLRHGHDINDANTGLFWEWYCGTVVEGVFVGRYSHSQHSALKPDLKHFRFHVTGWNSTLLDRDIVPRSYDLTINKNRHARLRIDGSAWQMLDPGSEDIYWYGDSFARHGYVVLALDISHRPKKDSEPLYGNGADYVGPKSALHPAIKADGFDDSDWAEDGERAWDAMRALDYLIELPYVDTGKILVTGLSMGGEISTVVAALDTRLRGCIPSGFSPDLDVILHRANDKTHHCWR